MQLRFNRPTARIEQLQAEQREATERNVDEQRATACKVASKTAMLPEVKKIHDVVNVNIDYITQDQAGVVYLF